MTDRHTFIERMGLAAETDGLSRIAGRLFGALILESEPRSLDDLAEQLDVSKASISTEARRLLDRGVAERVTRPGDRRDYYVLAPDFFLQTIRFRLGRWNKLEGLVRQMQMEQPNAPRLVRDRFAHIQDVNAFVLARVDEALREWAGETATRAPTPARSVTRASRQKSAAKPLAKRPMGKERLG